MSSKKRGIVCLCLFLLLLLVGCNVKNDVSESGSSTESIAPLTEPDCNNRFEPEIKEYDIQHIPLYSDEDMGFGIYSSRVMKNKVVMGLTKDHLFWYDLENDEVYDYDMPQGCTGWLDDVFPDKIVFWDIPERLFSFDYEMNLIKEVNAPPYTVPEEYESGVGPGIRLAYDRDLTTIFYCQSYDIREENRRVSSGLVAYDPQTGAEKVLWDNVSYFYNIYYMPEHNILFLYYPEVDQDGNPSMHSAILHLDDLYYEPLESTEGGSHHINGGDYYYIRLGQGYYDKIAGEYRIRPDVIPENISYGISRDGNLFYFFDRNKSLIEYEKNSDTSTEYVLGWDYKENDVIGVADNGDVVIRCRGSETMQGGLYRIRF